MSRVMVVASVTLASGDVPLLVVRALERLGCETTLVAVDEDLPVIEAMFLKNVHNFNRRLFNRRVLARADEFQPELLLIYGSNWGIFPETLRRIKKRTGCRVALWEGNLNYWQWYQVEAFRFYDYVFTMDSYPIPLLEKAAAGIGHVSFLGACCDPEEHGRVSASEDDTEHLGAEISFVGGGRPRRRALFEKLTGYRMKLWGWGWDESPVLAPHMVRETAYGLKKTKIYSCSQICPNLQSGLYQVHGISPRPVEVACCGRVPFSEPQPDLARFFDVGDEAVIFESAVDLRTKIDHYLRHPGELDRIGERARQRALAEHTYKHRMQELLGKVLN
jgi:spore maturation protein CgeB